MLRAVSFSANSGNPPPHRTVNVSIQERKPGQACGRTLPGRSATDLPRRQRSPGLNLSSAESNRREHSEP